VRLICTFALALVACGSGEVASDKPNSNMPKISAIETTTMAPVTETSAPTVAELAKQGLVRIDDEATGWSCGQDCTVDGFTAIYLGREKPKFSEADREYVCPVADGEMDNWKCRKVVENNG
jgi:hypothetical protein